MYESELKLSERVMYCRLLLEDFFLEIVYSKGLKNVLAGALSKLPKQQDTVDVMEAV